MAMVGIILFALVPVILFIAFGILALIVFIVNKIAAAVPVSEKIAENKTFQKICPFVCGFLFTLLGGAFLGSLVDSMFIGAGHGIYPYRHTFNNTTLLTAFIISVILLGIYIAFARLGGKEHTILPVILFSSIGSIFSMFLWLYMIFMVSDMKITAMIFK